MKKAIIIAAVFAFVASFAAPVLAADLPKPIHKFTHGIMTIVKSPIALYDHTKAGWDSHDLKPLGFTKGLIESPFYVIKEAGTGVVDVATFPVE